MKSRLPGAGRAGLILLGICACASIASATPGIPGVADKLGPRPEPVDVSAYAHVFHVTAGEGGQTAGEDQFATIGAALGGAGEAAADHRIAILVAEGVYIEAGLEMKPYVDLYGSFAAGQWEKRDIFEHASVIDGGSEHGKSPALRGADNARIDGFRITGGIHNAPGGAIQCEGVSPTISNNIITGNRTIHTPEIKPNTLHIPAHFGGAIAVYGGGSPTIRNNLIFGNLTDVGDGGAIAIRDGSKAVIEHNVIMQNHTGLADTTMYDGNQGSRSSNGGAISITGSEPRVAGNVIALNETHYTNDGGGIYVEYASPGKIVGNWLLANTTSDDGAAIYVRGDKENHAPDVSVEIAENVFAGNRNLNLWRNKKGLAEAIFLSKQGYATIRGNLFAANHAGIGNANSLMTAEGNTFVENKGPGIYVDLRGQYGHVKQSVIRGNLVWGNNPQIEYRRTEDKPPVIENNTVQGGMSGVAGEYLPEDVKGTLDTDPKFPEDGVSGKLTWRQFDGARFVTRLKVEAGEAKLDLPGRVIQVGKQWTVVKSGEAGELTVWGEITDAADTFRILPTYQPTVDVFGGMKE